MAANAPGGKVNGRDSGAAARRSPPRKMPQVRKITFDDVQAALRARGGEELHDGAGLRLRMGGIYALGGLAILSCIFYFQLTYLAYPLLAGFVLIGPSSPPASMR